jgi:membrane protease YdiL (CAAX protease family)
MLSKISLNYLLIFLFLFTIGYNSFFDGVLAYLNPQIPIIVYSILFITINNQWKQFAGYFCFKSIQKSDWNFGVKMVALAIGIQISGILLAQYFGQTLFDQYQYPLPFWVSPLLEETFYVGIALGTLWQPFRNKALEENNKFDYTILLPVLIIFYWITQSRSFYDTRFLDVTLTVKERILDFPGATFLGFLLSAVAFSKTRSLIPPLLIHYSMNTVVWLWLKM